MAPAVARPVCSSRQPGTISSQSLRIANDAANRAAAARATPRAGASGPRLARFVGSRGPNAVALTSFDCHKCGNRNFVCSSACAKCGAKPLPSVPMGPREKPLVSPARDSSMCPDRSYACCPLPPIIPARKQHARLSPARGLVLA